MPKNQIWLRNLGLENPALRDEHVMHFVTLYNTALRTSVLTAHFRCEAVSAQQERQLPQHDGHREMLVDRRRRARRPACREREKRCSSQRNARVTEASALRTAGTRASRAPRRTAATRCSRRRSPAALYASARSTDLPTARAAQPRLEKHAARRTGITNVRYAEAEDAHVGVEHVRYERHEAKRPTAADARVECRPAFYRAVDARPALRVRQQTPACA